MPSSSRVVSTEPSRTTCNSELQYWQQTWLASSATRKFAPHLMQHESTKRMPVVFILTDVFGIRAAHSLQFHSESASGMAVGPSDVTRESGQVRISLNRQVGLFESML